jgi:hypothetical protein
MKKLFFVASLFLSLTSISKAANVEGYNRLSGSFTITNEGPRVVPNTLPGTILMYVNVSSPSTNGTLRIYNSSGVASNQIANIDLNASGMYRYEVILSSGLTYTTTNNAGGVTFTFKRIRE